MLEVLIASSVLLVVVVAVTHAVTSGQQQTLIAVSNARAAALAEATLERVLQGPYTDPDGDTLEGPDAGENAVSDFDALDDFDGWTEAAGALKDAAGTDWPATYQTLSRSVSVSYTSVTVADLGGTHTGLTIVVTVTDAAGSTFTITRFVPEPVS